MKSNGDLQKDVYAELKWDSRINEGDIGVSASNGVVTLSGTIPSYAEKWAAEEDVKKIAGVNAVVNKINVRLPGTHVKSDQDVAEAALRAFEWNFWVPDDAKVMVENGWITLSGLAESEHEKQAAENIVKYLNGVRGVTNEIKVKPTAIAKDIQCQIKSALHRHAEEDAKSIQVDVNGSEVTLSGKVRSWKEKDDAEFAALCTAGVSKVKNNVSVSYF